MPVKVCNKCEIEKDNEVREYLIGQSNKLADLINKLTNNAQDS